jgi:hypothetical protein
MELSLHAAISFSLRGSRRTMFDGGDHLAGVAEVDVDVGARGEAVKIRRIFNDTDLGGCYSGAIFETLRKNRVLRCWKKLTSNYKDS